MIKTFTVTLFLVNSLFSQNSVVQQFSDSFADVAEAAKVIKDFSKENEAFVIKGGLMDSEPLTLDQINVLAEIEPRDVLLAKIAGGFNAPLVKVAASAKAVINKAGYALSALVDKKASGEEVSEATNSNEEEVASDEVKNEEE